jgi:tRNA(fMet)-specific endonuclease VapC
MGRLSYLLDSNILSEPSRPHPNVHVQSRLLAHRHAVCTAALVLHEMCYGLARLPDGRRKQALTHYLEQAVHQRLMILPYGRGHGWPLKGVHLPLSMGRSRPLPWSTA